MGARIKALRIASKKGSYEKFALDHGLCRSLYWDWEQGCNLNWKGIKRIIEIHGLSVPDFFREGFDEED